MARISVSEVPSRSKLHPGSLSDKLRYVDTGAGAGGEDSLYATHLRLCRQSDPCRIKLSSDVRHPGARPVHWSMLSPEITRGYMRMANARRNIHTDRIGASCFHIYVGAHISSTGTVCRHAVCSQRQ